MDFVDPLRGPDTSVAAVEDLRDIQDIPPTTTTTIIDLPEKEWNSFKKFLMQRFSASRMISISSVSSDVVIRSGGKANEKLSTNVHLDELEDPEKFAAEGVKVITQQEYVARLHELKDEITHAWHADDRVTSLKLCIKVARLLTDTSVLQFYPMLFVLATDVMDMLGDMVWERVKRRAEFSEDGTIICSLPETFGASDVCNDAKETCHNWFCKIASIQELLPRIYLELAILPCWTFLLDQPLDSVERLVRMTRGLADPLASAYCRLYMAFRMQKFPSCDVGSLVDQKVIGFLITCINDINDQLMRIISMEGSMRGSFSENRRMLISLIEPSIEYIMKCIFKAAHQRQVGNMLLELWLGRSQSKPPYVDRPYVSVVLHHLLIEVPVEVIKFNAVEILHLIGCSNDYSFDQCLNYRILGLRLCETRFQKDTVDAVLYQVMKVVNNYTGLEEYLKVVDAYMDIILQNQMDIYLDVILEGIIQRAHSKEIADNELTTLQSVFVKLLSHFKDLETVFALSHFFEILDAMHGSSRNVVNVQILTMATRGECIHNPTTIQLLFEISQALHDAIDISKADDGQQLTRLIARFVHMVDYGEEVERHLAFLVECRGAFGSINKVKETIVHTSNGLAIKAIKDLKKHMSFAKSCIAFNEVTIPAISGCIRQLDLYLETAEVAFLGGLVSHLDELVDLAMSSLQSLDLMEGSLTPNDIDDIVSLVRKLSSLLVVVPGTLEQGVTCIKKTILSLINSTSQITSRMRTRILIAIISLSATITQNMPLYHASQSEIFCNDLLFFDDSPYSHEFVSLSELFLSNLVDVIQQEPSRAARGSMALEACNCITSSFRMTPEISLICSKLVETAKMCLSANDNHLQSTMKLLDGNMHTPPAATPSIAIR